MKPITSLMAFFAIVFLVFLTIDAVTKTVDEHTWTRRVKRCEVKANHLDYGTNLTTNTLERDAFIRECLGREVRP